MKKRDIEQNFHISQQRHGSFNTMFVPEGSCTLHNVTVIMYSYLSPMYTVISTGTIVRRSNKSERKLMLFNIFVYFGYQRGMANWILRNSILKYSNFSKTTSTALLHNNFTKLDNLSIKMKI